MSTNLITALKELGRVLLIALVSWLLTDGLIELILGALFGTRLDPTTKITISSIILAGLKALDKWLHEHAKDQPKADRNEGFLGVKGITNF